MEDSLNSVNSFSGTSLVGLENTLSVLYEEEGNREASLRWLLKCIEDTVVEQIEKHLSHEKSSALYKEAVARFIAEPGFKKGFSKQWFRASVLQNMLKRYEEALSSADESLRGDPDNPACWVERTRALMGLGRYKEALNSIRYARQLKPDSQYILATEAAVLKAMGDYESAARVYKKLWK